MEKQDTLLKDLTYTVTGDFDNSGIYLNLHVPQRNDYVFGQPVDISNNNLNAILIGMKTADEAPYGLQWQSTMPLLRLNPITSLREFGDSGRFNPALNNCLIVVYHDLTINEDVVRSFYDKVQSIYQNYTGPVSTVWTYDPDKKMTIPKRVGMTVVNRRT